MDWKKIIILVMIAVGVGLISSFFLFFRNKKKEIALSLFSFTFALLISEIFIRRFYPQINEHDKMFEYDANLGWRFVPNKKGNILYQGEAHHYIETNSRGFRDNAPRSKLDKTKKILVLGDSFVSNISVKSKEVFTEVMEEWLENTEVVNFGVNGYGQVQEYLQLQEWHSSINPDVILLMIYIRNDFKDNIGDDWLYSRPYASWDEESQTIKINPILPQKAPKQEPSEPSWKIYRKSHLYTLLRRRIDFLSAKFSQQDQASIYTPPELYLCLSPLSEDTQVMYCTMEELLLKIANYTDEIGVPLVFAIAPSIVQVEDKLWSSLILSSGKKPGEYIRTLPNDELMRFAETNNLRMVDLLPILRSETKKGKTLYNPNEQHWTSEGNRIVARSLLDYLKTSSLIE